MIIVDRIENGFAVCEIDGVMTDIPLSLIDGKPNEGSSLNMNEGGIRYTVDNTEAQTRNATLTAKFNRIKARRGESNANKPG